MCQIGVGVFEDLVLVDTWKSFIDPQDSFHWFMINIHGITANHVKGMPTFPMVYPFLRKMFENSIVVHHTQFDRIAFRKAYDKYNLEPFPAHWLDSAQVARNTWKEYGDGGFNLEHIAYRLGIEFQHHDALEDAVACGKVVVEAIKNKGVQLDKWLSYEK